MLWESFDRMYPAAINKETQIWNLVTYDSITDDLSNFLVILTVEVASAKAVFNAPAELLNILSWHIVGTEVSVEKWGHSNVAVVC